MAQIKASPMLHPIASMKIVDITPIILSTTLSKISLDQLKKFQITIDSSNLKMSQVTMKERLSIRCLERRVPIK